MTEHSDALIPASALEGLGIPLPKPIEPAEIQRYAADEPEPPLYRSVPNVTATIDSGNPKDLIGNTKADLSLVPPAASLYTAAGFADGAAKYGPYNWRENKVKARVYIAAAMRHLSQYLDGENTDPISDVPHLGHAMACLAILADATETGNLIDDRPKPGAAGNMIRRYTPEKKFG